MHFWSIVQSTVSRLKRTQKPNNENLCLFRALHLNGNQKLEKQTTKVFNLFITRKNGLNPDQLQGVHMKDIPVVVDLVSLNILLYNVDTVDAKMIGE